MNVFSYLDVQNYTIPYIVDQAVTEFEDRIYKRLSKIYASYFFFQETNRILQMNYIPPQKSGDLIEDVEPKQAIFDNRASFKLKIEQIQRNYQIDHSMIPQNNQRTLSSFDDKISKKSQILMNRSRVFSMSRQSDMSKSPTKRKLTTFYHFIPLEQDQASDKDLDNYLIEESLRNKKQIQALKEEKYKKIQNEKKKNKVVDSESNKKFLKELQKKAYTYDYDGQIIFRKKNNLNHVLYKEINSKFDAPKKESQKLMEVEYINQSKEQSVYTQNEDRLSRQTLNQEIQSKISKEMYLKAQNDLYNNNDQRQTSHLPFIKLKDGVTIREYSKGKEEIRNNEIYDQKLENIQRKEYLELLETNDKLLLKQFQKHHNIKAQNTLLEQMNSQIMIEYQQQEIQQQPIQNTEVTVQIQPSNEGIKKEAIKKQQLAQVNKEKRNKSTNEQQNSYKELHQISKTQKMDELNFQIQPQSHRMVETIQQNYRLPIIPLMKKKNQNHQMRRLNKHSSKISNMSDFTNEPIFYPTYVCSFVQ